jgi:RimJ/RimL family protein N-acetyltransferase
MAFPLITDRLRIEPLTFDDVPAFVAYRRDPEIARFQNWDTSYDASRANRLVVSQEGWAFPPAGEWMQLAIHQIDPIDVVGDVALHKLVDQPDTFEIGFTLSASAQGNGFATEAALALCHYVFDEANAHRIVAFCDARNTASARVLERLGMRHESHIVDADFFKGEWTTLDGYAILAREFRARHHPR